MGDDDDEDIQPVQLRAVEDSGFEIEDPLIGHASEQTTQDLLSFGGFGEDHGMTNVVEGDLLGLETVGTSMPLHKAEEL